MHICSLTFSLPNFFSSKIPLQSQLFLLSQKQNTHTPSKKITEPKTPTPRRPLALTGTLLVRNVSYHKTVAVRFTMDDWHTTNDVLASYEKSLGALPARFVLGASGVLVAADAESEISSSAANKKKTDTRICSPYAVDSPDDTPVEPGRAPAWDRFRFEINLEDVERVIEGRVLWLVGRYSACASAAGAGAGEGGVLGDEGKEWWDNNGGMNYRVGFRRVGGREREAGERRRGLVVSAPSTYQPTLSKAYPAPPQISASVSLPVAFESSRPPFPHRQTPYSISSSPTTQQQQQQPPSQQTSSQPSPTVEYTQQQHLPSQERAYIEQHLPHRAAVAQTTLARLRKFSLSNYAAPTGYGAPLLPSGGAGASAVKQKESETCTPSALALGVVQGCFCCGGGEGEGGCEDARTTATAAY
ncbi:hypothetical protein BDN70DRAFT_352012 [Pholiota conissans]|uniref:CBM21 domain-containing protein n=1 Tax=Pholiota conissans TaxID=109636 RepID=A0A9P5YU06_9AGAR|nr:hypothetical protein BDN70DRAFT_352012 [Pholiota conissans]